MTNIEIKPFSSNDKWATDNDCKLIISVHKTFLFNPFLSSFKKITFVLFWKCIFRVLNCISNLFTVCCLQSTLIQSQFSIILATNIITSPKIIHVKTFIITFIIRPVKVFANNTFNSCCNIFNCSVNAMLGIRFPPTAYR